MESLPLALLHSGKPCPKLPKHSPNLGIRPFTQVGFGSLWGNHAKSACLMARSSVNISGGGGSGTHDSLGNDSERKRFDWISPSDMISYGEIGELETQDLVENLEDEKFQLIEIQLKEIQEVLRKNNEEIKMLKETAKRLWGRLRIEVLTAIRMQDLIDKNRKHAQQDLNTTVTASTHESAIGKSPQTHKPGTKPEGAPKRKGNFESNEPQIKKKRGPGTTFGQVRK